MSRHCHPVRYFCLIRKYLIAYFSHNVAVFSLFCQRREMISPEYQQFFQQIFALAVDFLTTYSTNLSAIITDYNLALTSTENPGYKKIILSTVSIFSSLIQVDIFYGRLFKLSLDEFLYRNTTGALTASNGFLSPTDARLGGIISTFTRQLRNLVCPLDCVAGCTFWNIYMEAMSSTISHVCDSYFTIYHDLLWANISEVLVCWVSGHIFKYLLQSDEIHISHGTFVTDHRAVSSAVAEMHQRLSETVPLALARHSPVPMIEKWLVPYVLCLSLLQTVTENNTSTAGDRSLLTLRSFFRRVQENASLQNFGVQHRKELACLFVTRPRLPR